jgi:hypothetical protein
MTPNRPLPTLLAQALTAYTIEFDNEAERQIAARQLTGPGRRARLMGSGLQPPPDGS